MTSLTSPPYSSSSTKFKHLAPAEVCPSNPPTPRFCARARTQCLHSSFLPRHLLQDASSLCHGFRLALPRPVHHMGLPLQLCHETLLHRQQRLHLISHESPFPVRYTPRSTLFFLFPRLRQKLTTTHSTLHAPHRATGQRMTRLSTPSASSTSSARRCSSGSSSTTPST